ncbi:lactate permease [Bryocella elongata]|uniref:L-lactate permease n=1 Tax=Bryocella elongata TaxID=863522 RepID=A0A1H5ZL98_9BACT|nr:L-lactate permease [Bryocella elongata]SEG37219.1 lactate permease [Bryocella elongata]
MLANPTLKTWAQGYNPTGHIWLSTALAAMPLVLLLALMLAVRMKAHRAALITLLIAIATAVVGFHMPVKLALLSTMLGGMYGLFPIFWIILPVIFLYELTVRAGRFALLQQCVGGITADGRLQLLLIAFTLGAFFEGASGFGTPVAVCGALLLGLGFEPLQAAAYVLLANTAPVAFGALGTPVIGLHGVTGIDTLQLTRTIALLLTPFCVIVPFWLITSFAGFRSMLEVWPAVLLAGGLFGAVQLTVATFHGPWLVNIAASLITLVALVILCRHWKPRTILGPRLQVLTDSEIALCTPSASDVRRALTPWLILALFVAPWGTPAFSHWLDSFSAITVPIRGLHLVVLRMPPIVPMSHAEPATFLFNWLSATGTGILIAAIAAGFTMGLGLRDMLGAARETIIKTRFTMITIAALMGLAFLTRYCGLDAVLGLAFARTGSLYPFFGTLIGWLGTASTGSDTSSNVLFGSLQKLTAQQLGLSATLMAAANSGGGVMGKMIAPQSVVVASTATESYGKEGSILRMVILHSLALACLMGSLVLVSVHIPFLARLLSR